MPQIPLPKINRALISVYDKTGIVPFAQRLNELGIEIISTGGTASLLEQEGVPVTHVSNVTDFPEIMGGRVKTLHPKIQGALLSRGDVDNEVMAEHGIDAIGLVVANLYPFINVIQDPDTTYDDAIENIDIGGPTMLRASAKNHRHVTVVTDPRDYESILEELAQHGGVNEEKRLSLARKVFALTTRYDFAISQYLERMIEDTDFPSQITVNYYKQNTLRYGENPHQQAAFYRQVSPASGTIANAKLLQGKALSYNNLADSDAALDCAKEFERPACVIVKHANPCGVALANDIEAAYQRAYACDPTSSYGGIIAVNRELDAATAKAILEQQFVEVIIAPYVSPEAQAVCQQKPNLRLLETGAWDNESKITAMKIKQISGGLLVQTDDQLNYHADQLKQVSAKPCSDALKQDLLFAWAVAKHVKSNAIVFASQEATVGIGAGQMSRIDSTQIAASKAKAAGFDLSQAVMASDAFFPFPDNIEHASKLGIQAVIQPGGSIRDDAVIEAADKADMVMLFTGIRHFRH